MNLLEVMLAAPLGGVETPFTAPVVIHAVTSDELARVWPAGPCTSVCGTPVKLLAIPVLDGDPVLWPPPHRMPAPFSRCRDCWLATGKRRPRCELRAAA